MEQENLVTDKEETEQTGSGYVPRNRIVAAKENIYSKINISIRQVDMFIGGCVVVILALVLIGLQM